MKVSLPFSIRALVLGCLTLTLGALAQDASVPPEKPAAPDAPAEVAPAPAETPAATESSPAPVAPAAPSAPETPAAAPVPEADAALEKDQSDEAALAEPDRERAQRQNRWRREYRSDIDEMPLGDHVISKGSSAQEAVSLFGSTVVEGEAASDAVAIIGDTVVAQDAEVHGAAVSILGRLNVRGRVQGEAVNVLGASSIDGYVGGEAVAVLSDLHLGPNAVIDGDLILVGGTLTRDAGAVVNGDEVRMTIPVIGSVGGFEGLSTWVKKCLLWGRLLAFDANVIWAWWVAGAFLALYVVLSLLFRTGVDTCVQTLETRPGSTVVASILTVLLLPVLTVLLVLTVIGGVLVPFIGIASFFGTLFGKSVVLAWLGRRITRHFGDGPLNHAAFATLVGGAILLLLYTVPVVGIILYKVFGVLGLGVVVYTLVLRSQREKVSAPAVAGVPSGGVTSGVVVSPPVAAPIQVAAPVAPPPVVIGAVPAPEVAARSATASATSAVPSAMPGPSVPMNTLPRAGFWIRLGALAIDLVLIAAVLGLLSHVLPRMLQPEHGPGSVMTGLAIYGALLWKLKGTTIGGIVCGLKVVRLDGRELDWATVIVRALSCFLSLFIAGLGFIWVVIDDDKQSWHDKIAGTVVVRVPKGMALV